MGLLKLFRLKYALILSGKSFIIPVRNGIGMDHYLPIEPWMIDCLKELLTQKQGAFVDVGVNIGQTLLKFRSLDDREYIGFEPNVKCIEYVRKLIQINQLQNVKIYPFGISDRSHQGLLNSYFNYSTDSTASLLSTFRPENRIVNTIEVELIGPYEVGAIITMPVAIIKIDVEGYEWFVLKSMEGTIEACRPFIIIEILPVYDTTNIDRLHRQEKIEEFLKVNHYSLFRIEKNSSNCFSNISFIDAIGIHSDINLCDYIAAPQELSDKLLSLWKK